MLVPYRRFIAWEVEDVGDEDKSGVADPAWGETNGVIYRKLNAIKLETNLLTNECYLVVMDGVLRHHVKNPGVFFRRRSQRGQPRRCIVEQIFHGDKGTVVSSVRLWFRTLTCFGGD